RALPARGYGGGATQACRGLGGRRRPTERWQIVTGQSIASRRADDRQRDSWHYQRRRGLDHDLASPYVSHRRYGWYPQARPGRPLLAGRIGGRAAVAPVEWIRRYR